ncbi:metallophosphoesterase family protein [Ancylomarina sp. YFZ004]
MVRRFLRYSHYFLAFIIVSHWGCSKLPDIESEGESWSFATFGDVGRGFGIYAHLSEKIGSIQPRSEFTVCLGDVLLEDGNEIEWIKFWRLSEPITDVMPLYMVRGNHEGNSPKDNLFFSKQTGLPVGQFNYTFSHRNSLFIILDSYKRGHEFNIGSSQFEWLKHQLDSVSDKVEIQNIFIFMHHPIFHWKYPMEVSEQLHGLFKGNNKIKIIFAGHNHRFDLSKKDEINYVISGGGGSPLDHENGGDYFHFLKISVFEKTNRINVKSIGIYNEVVDEFDL